MKSFGVVFLLLCLAHQTFQARIVSVLFSNGEYQLVTGTKDPNGVAWGWFDDTINETGWALLRIESNPKYSNTMQSYAAGFAEGALTQARIYQMFNAIMDSYSAYPESQKTQLYDWLNEEWEWMSDQVESNPSESYWHHISKVQSQTQGIYDGYALVAQGDEASFTFEDLIFMNALADHGDIVASFDPAYRIGALQKTLSREELMNQINYRLHCSAFIKVLGDLSDIYFAHNMWTNYKYMFRIYKFYDMKLSDAKAQVISMSSYPGFLASYDDYYVTSSGLAVMETTNSILNDTLYDYVTPQSVLYWVRTVIANRYTNNGHDWVHLFEKYNSGTYNNQWMVLDYKKFTAGTLISDGALWILEQIPGFCEKGDVTSYLRLGYWPSYNVPFFETIYNKSGYIPYYQAYGNWFSYMACPRAQIFRRDQGKVADLDGFRSFMRYNQYQTDPYSLGSPDNQIASRHDLSASNPDTFGAIDAKVTTYYGSKNLESWIASGPTHDSQPVFSWDDPKWLHKKPVGQPTSYPFDWITVDYEDI